MIVQAGLLIDFGNSETRVILLQGNRSFRFNLSNKFAELPAGYNVNSRYANDKSTIFAFDGTYFANGLIVEREFKGVEIRPSALQSKTVQLATDLTLNLAVIKSLGILSQALNQPISALQVSFNISALLPPLDHEVNEQQMVEKLQKLKTVSALLPLNINMDVKVNTVTVYPEAVAAFFGIYFQEEGAKVNPDNEGKSPEKGHVIIRDIGPSVELVDVPENEKFATGYTIVLDIGAGTTDIALFKDMELVEKSKDTFKRGGKTVESIVLQEIKKKFGFTPTSIESVINNGLLEEGNEAHDVSAFITSAKEQYSRATLEDIRTYLERLMIDMPVIKGLAVAGGGSLATLRDDVEVSPAMADILIKYLKTLAPRMEALSAKNKNQRDLNIDGLLYLHRYAG